VQELLESEGYHVRAFANGREALDGLVNCEKPCLILLDLMMPVMNGQEFLDARKTAGDLMMAIPVVIVSAYADISRSTEGVVGYIKKPVDVDLLLRMVGQQCQHQTTRSA
jgi:CheY-like chemotaxis protein